jgi:hypothetical protein
VCTSRCLLQPVGRQLVATQQFGPHIEQHIAEQSLQGILTQSIIIHIVQSYPEIHRSQPQQH